MHPAVPIPSSVLLAFFACLVLAGCANTQPYPYAGLQSSSQLRLNIDGDSQHVPYRLAKNTDWAHYSRAMLDPVVIYRGTDHQFEEVSEDEKTALANYMRSRFSGSLATRFQMVSTPTPGTLRVRLTLTGAKATTRGVSTFTRFDLAGGPYNAVQAIRGKEGTFTGSVSYAVEIFDASGGELLEAFVAKQFPNAWNLGATLGKLDAARTGIEKGADQLAAQF